MTEGGAAGMTEGWGGSDEVVSVGGLSELGRCGGGGGLGDAGAAAVKGVARLAEAGWGRFPLGGGNDEEVRGVE